MEVVVNIFYLKLNIIEINLYDAVNSLITYQNLQPFFREIGKTETALIYYFEPRQKPSHCR